jgi:hypothetical protein
VIHLTIHHCYLCANLGYRKRIRDKALLQTLSTTNGDRDIYWRSQRLMRRLHPAANPVNPQKNLYPPDIHRLEHITASIKSSYRDQFCIGQNEAVTGAMLCHVKVDLRQNLLKFTAVFSC